MNCYNLENFLKTFFAYPLQALATTDLNQMPWEVLTEMLRRRGQQFDRTKKFTWKTAIDSTYSDYSVFAVFEIGRTQSERVVVQNDMRQNWQTFMTNKTIEMMDLDLDIDALYREFVTKYPFRIKNDFSYVARNETPTIRTRNRRAEFTESDTVIFTTCYK